MVGTQVGNYLIQELLGEGGMGKVYRGLEVVLERPVAIKVLNPDLARNPGLVERFRVEARTQANLMHPNVAVLYAFLVQDGNAMMVMEFVDGQNIQDIVRHAGPLNFQQAIPWFKQALAGIGAAHKLGIVHRDIKPSNLMLTRAGVVKVLDFGIAKATTSERRLTSAGAKVGTVYYMSPEQIQAAPVDNRSDIYALGVTLFEMVTARVPFDSDSDFTIQRDHLQTPPPLATAFAPYLPRGVEKIILRAMEKNPAERFQSVEEFSAALDNFAQWESYVPTFARGASVPPQPAPNRRTVMEGALPPPNFAPPPVRGATIAEQNRGATVMDAVRQPAVPLPAFNVPPPGGETKSFWADKWKIYAAAGLALLIIGFFIFRGSGEKTGPNNTPNQPQNPVFTPGQNPAENPNQNPPQPPQNAMLQQLNGVWDGGFKCGDFTSQVQISISAQSADNIAGIAEYHSRSGAPVVYNLRGVYSPQDSRLVLRPISWIQHPEDVLVAPGYDGKVGFNPRVYAGTIQCGFQVTWNRAR